MLLDLSSLPFPATNGKIFRRDAPLVLEIGFGDGGFLHHTAKSHPEWNFLGADIARGSVARAFRRLQRSRASNVRLYHGSGLFLLRNLLCDESLFRVYVNFPDPWRKKRHAGRRLFQPVFFDLLATRLEVNGTLLFTTDDAPYFEQTVTLARDSGHYQVTEKAPPPAVLQTKYAGKWHKAGRNVYHAHLQKQTRCNLKFPPDVQKEDGMHHALLNGSIPMIKEFEKVVHHFPNGHVVVLDAMYMIGREGMVFVARSHEPELVQELFLQLRPAEKAGADLFLGILNFGKPIATRGTREAVKAVTHWLVQQDLTLSETFY